MPVGEMLVTEKQLKDRKIWGEEESQGCSEPLGGPRTEGLGV